LAFEKKIKKITNYCIHNKIEVFFYTGTKEEMQKEIMSGRASLIFGVSDPKQIHIKSALDRLWENNRIDFEDTETETEEESITTAGLEAGKYIFLDGDSSEFANPVNFMEDSYSVGLKEGSNDPMLSVHSHSSLSTVFLEISSDK
jgi:hypothetical protein